MPISKVVEIKKIFSLIATAVMHLYSDKTTLKQPYLLKLLLISWQAVLVTLWHKRIFLHL